MRVEAEGERVGEWEQESKHLKDGKLEERESRAWFLWLGVSPGCVSFAGEVKSNYWMRKTERERENQNRMRYV